MEHKMAEQEKTVPRNKVMKTGIILATLFSVALIAARFAGVLPMPQNMSAGGVIALCVSLTAIVAGYVGWYLYNTDEHDLHANLWSMAWAWIASALITVNWSILHVGGLAPVPNALIIFLGSAVAAASVWAWLRFR
jgi:hypothetical protein